MARREPREVGRLREDEFGHPRADGRAASGKAEGRRPGDDAGDRPRGHRAVADLLVRDGPEQFAETGISRSKSPSQATGVTSSIVIPVPPVVTIQSTSVRLASRSIVPRMAAKSSRISSENTFTKRTESVLPTGASVPVSADRLSIAEPESSGPSGHHLERSPYRFSSSDGERRHGTDHDTPAREKSAEPNGIAAEQGLPGSELLLQTDR
jgi:hypothetical protein